MENNKGHITLPGADDKAYLPLYDFFITLKRNNFLVTPLQIADANRLIEKYALTVKSETELCNYLVPVFANSEEEQIQFRQLFEEFFLPQLKLVPKKESVLLQAELPPEKEKKKKKAAYKLLVRFLSALLLLVAWFLLRTGHKEIIKPQYLLDDEVSSTDSGKTQRGYRIRIYPDTLREHFSYKIKYDWGDNSPLDTSSLHIYGKDSIYLFTAYVSTYYKDVIKFNDTLPQTVVICSHPADIKIEKSFAGDSIPVGRIFTLRAIIKGKQPDSILWTNTGQAVIENNRAIEIKTALYQEGAYSFICNPFFGGINNPCNTQASIAFTVYDTIPKPSVIIRPAKNASLIVLPNKVHGYWFYGLGGLAILLLFLVSFFDSRRKRLQKQNNNLRKDTQQQYDEMIRSFSGKSGGADIPFYNKNFLPVPEPELSDISRMMRKRINDDVAYMHVEKTIAKAILNAGFFEPVIATRTQQSEFLILISKKNTNDQQAKLFDFLVDQLKKQNVLIDKYYYKTTPLVCYNDNEGVEISLEKLSEKYPEHILLIFGDAYQLIYPEYPVIVQEHMALLNRWQYKAIITPVSFNDWGNKEKKILLQQMPVFPVDIAGQLLIMQKLFVEDLNIVSVLNQYSDAFYEAEMVDFEDIDELLQYCTEAGWAKVNNENKYSNILFQWIAALAVYPKISWELTLSIGKAILDKNNLTQQLNFTNLLRLARISWMHSGQMPDFTRLNLLKQLSIQNEIITRETILQAIIEIPETELNNTHFAFEEKELQRLINEFNLYAYAPDKYPGYSNSKALFEKLNKDELITDVTAKSYLENPELGWDTLINKQLPDADSVKKPENISLQHYLDDDPEKNSLRARLYNVAIKCTAWAFIGSLLALVFLFVLNIAGKFSLLPFTYKKHVDKKIQINHYNSAADSTIKNLTISIDTADADFTKMYDYTTDSNRKMILLPVSIDDSAKEFIVNWNQFTIFDSSMIIRYDAYDVELTNHHYTPVITVNFLLPPNCKAGISTYKSIIAAVDSNIIVKETDVVTHQTNNQANMANYTNSCLNSIGFGALVDRKKIERIVKGFLDYGVNLKVDQSKFAAGQNDIVIYDAQESQITAKPVVYVLISDTSLTVSAQKFKRELEGNGFTVKPVSLSSFSYNSDIYYYSDAQQFNANKINSLYKKYYPALKVQAHLAKPPPGQALKDTNAIVVWIKILQTAKPLNGLTINSVHYTSLDKKITGDFYVNPKTNSWEESNNDALNKGQVKIMNLKSRTENTINLISEIDYHNINIDLKAGIITVDVRKTYDYDILSVTDGKTTRTYSPGKKSKTLLSNEQKF